MDQQGRELLYVCCKCEPNCDADARAILYNRVCPEHGFMWHRLMRKTARGTLELAHPVYKREESAGA